MKCQVFFTAFSVFVLFATAQQKTFDVVLLGNVIGYSTITKKTESKDVVVYNLQSSTKAKILFQEKSQELQFEAKYVGGALLKSLCKVINNGELAITDVMREGKEYVIKRKDDIVKTTEPITFSSMELYFSEPVNVPKVFSERMGEFASFTKTAPGEYMNKIKDVTNIYRYRNGALYEVEIRKALGSVFLRARN